MFDITKPPKADCRVLLTYADGVITNARIAKDGEELDSAKSVAESMHKKGWQLVPAQGLRNLVSSIKYWRDTDEVSASASQQLIEQISALVNGEACP